MPKRLQRHYGQKHSSFCYVLLLPASLEARRFWQRRFYDFNVWSHAKKKEKLHYMHANPVKERLVQDAKDWPWSSFSFYAKDEQGLLWIDAVD